MSEIDILRREGARDPEDFEAHGYSREDAEAMSDVVKGAERATAAGPVCGNGCGNRVGTGVEYCINCLTAMIAEQGEGSDPEGAGVRTNTAQAAVSEGEDRWQRAR